MRDAGAADGAAALSRILAYTPPSHGELFPLVPALEELRRRGHEVAIRTLAGAVGTMRALGFEAVPIAAEIEALAMEDWRARSPAGAIVRSVRTFGARAELDARDLRRAIEAERPDALLVNVVTWGALSAAEAWGGPWACTCAHPLPLSSRAGPPFGPGLRPARGPAGRLRDRLLRLPFGAGFDRVVLPWLNPVRTGLGLRPFAHAEEMYLAPPLLLYMSAEPFEYPRPDWPESIVMVGPCPWEPPGELAPELGEIEAPLVLVTTSTDFQNDGRQGCACRPTRRCCASRHAPILARSACAITHGGMGATQKALALGVPVCAVPFGRDQYEVARRVEVAGAGSRLPAWRLRPGRLRAKVGEAIGCRAGADRLVEAYAGAGGADAAADAFERLL